MTQIEKIGFKYPRKSFTRSRSSSGNSDSTPGSRYFQLFMNLAWLIVVTEKPLSFFSNLYSVQFNGYLQYLDGSDTKMYVKGCMTKKSGEIRDGW